MCQPATCYLNGDLVALESARISPLDRGFLFGDGVYEVLPCYRGVPFRVEDHLRRLRFSLEATRIPNPMDDPAWRQIIEQVCSSNGGGDLSVYLQVTRGAPTHRSHEFPEESTPTIFAMASPLPPAETAEPGLAAYTRDDLRWARCDIKSVALLPNVLLRQEAVEAGGQEAILHRGGIITEGAASTVFVVQDGTLVTPALHSGLLPGVTRQVVLELAGQHGMPYTTRSIALEELHEADEVWLSSSTKEVAPVITVDDRPVGDGKPGPHYHRMRDWFGRLRSAVARGEYT